MWHFYKYGKLSILTYLNNWRISMGATIEATLQLAQGGRVVIPSRLRQALHLVEGSRMVARLTKHGLLLIPVDEALDQLQEEARKLLADAPSLSAELMSDRRAEASRG